MDDEKIPDYLKDATFDADNGQGNFDHTDILWRGEDGNLDPEQLISGYGWGGKSALFHLINALIAGHQSDLPPDQREAMAATVERSIVGAKRGPPDKDDSSLLLEIAVRYHQAWFESGGKKPALMTICKEVVTEYRMKLGREGSDDHLPKALAKKFKQNPDLWLSRATMADDYYAPGRRSTILMITQALTLLKKLGIHGDARVVTVPMRPEGKLRQKVK